ncbi:MAG: dockerin type I repeat-containing protein, partial [Clostridia bacterium]|nr:dockerin type I repeat-containing protein [Clostridia bacterium]
VIVTYGEYSDVFTISITTNHRLGDFNGDGEITPEDARLTLRAAVGIIRMAQVTFNAADVDKDNEVTPADARIILRASVGLEKL